MKEYTVIFTHKYIWTEVFNVKARNPDEAYDKAEQERQEEVEESGPLFMEDSPDFEEILYTVQETQKGEVVISILGKQFTVKFDELGNKTEVEEPNPKI